MSWVMVKAEGGRFLLVAGKCETESGGGVHSDPGSLWAAVFDITARWHLGRWVWAFLHQYQHECHCHWSSCRQQHCSQWEASPWHSSCCSCLIIIITQNFTTPNQSMMCFFFFSISILPTNSAAAFINSGNQSNSPWNRPRNRNFLTSSRKSWGHSPFNYFQWSSA